MNPKVDWFFNKPGQWQEEYKKLRQIVLSCDLTEVLKWGQPCYQYQEKNIVVIHGFKEYCAFLFFKGAIVKDPKKILIQQTENVQSARQIRFKNMSEIKKLEKTLKAYIYAAVEIEESGKKVELKKTHEFKMPDEFKIKLAKMPKLKKAFEALTPGRQRGYLLYFSSAKQEKTRVERVEKYVKKILAGKGLEDE